MTAKQIVFKLLKNLLWLVAGLGACALLLYIIYTTPGREPGTYMATDTYPDEVGLGAFMGLVAMITVPIVLITWVTCMLYSAVVNWEKSRLYSVLNALLTSLPFLVYGAIGLNDAHKEKRNMERRDALIATPQLEKLDFAPGGEVTYAYTANGVIHFLTAEPVIPEVMQTKPAALAYTSFTDNLYEWKKSGFEFLASIDTTTMRYYTIDNGRISPAPGTGQVLDTVWHERGTLYTPDSSSGGQIRHKPGYGIRNIWYRLKNNGGTQQNTKPLPFGFREGAKPWPQHYSYFPFYTDSVSAIQFYAVEPAPLREKEHGVYSDTNVYVAVFSPTGVKVYRFADLNGSYPITMLPSGNFVYVFYKHGIYRFRM